MSAKAPFAAALAALALLAASSRAPAQIAPAPSDASAEPIRVSLEGHAGCGDGEEFLRQVLARTPRARRAEASEAARSFTVRIVARPPNSSGTLSVREATGATSQREVTAATCGEVIAALALVAAITIDPRAATTPIPSPEASPAPAPTEPAPESPASAPVPPPAHKPAPAPAKPPPAAEVDAGPRPIAAPESPPPWRVRLGAQAAAELMSGIAPEVVFLPRPLLELELAIRGSSWLVPSVRLSAARGEGSGSVENVGSARFVWTGGRIELCPVLAASGGAYARPCVGFEAAGLRASGEGLPETRSERRPWLAPLAIARAGFRFPFGLTFELYGGASLPLIDDDFEFNDRKNGRIVRVHEIPAVSLMGGVAVGLSGEFF